MGSLLEPFFHSRLFPGFICVFLMRQCSEWQSGGSCLTSEERSNGLPGASPVSFSSPPPCHGGSGGASDPGGWTALRVLALSMSSLSRNHRGDLLSEPWVEKGACGGLEGVARHQSTSSLSRNPGLTEKGVSELQVSPFVFSRVVLPFKCKEETAQQEHLCSLGFCG